MRVAMNFTAPNRIRTKSRSTLSSTMLIILSASVVSVWTMAMVGSLSQIEGATAFCPTASRTIRSRNKATPTEYSPLQNCRIPSLLRVATAVQPVSAEETPAQTDTTKNNSSRSPAEKDGSQPPRAAAQPPKNNNNSDNNNSKGNQDDAGVVGDWENLHGNWVLRPKLDPSNLDEFNASGSQPRAVIHFLGGALVGKAPHITYRYMLEKLAAEGFLIVATPYDLSFDHLSTCDDVLTRFEAVAPTLAKQYGALPVVGIGHSCGALLQVLISSLFPDTPRAANALLSFNNKPVSDAVPFFEEFFAPLFSSLAVGPELGGTDGGASTGRGPSSNDSLVLGLKLAKAASQGRLPSDELLEEAQRVLGGGFLAAAAQTTSLFPSFPLPVPPFFGNDGNQGQSFKIPTKARETYEKWAEPTVTALSEAGVLPVIYETIVSLEQIPRLIDEVADGARDFDPTPASVRSAAGKAYRPRRTLIVGYEDDPIDESGEIEEVLKEARSITRMKRPMVEIDVERKVLGGGHAAPLLAPPLDVAERAEDLLGVETSKERLGYTEAAATVEDLVRWLEEGNL
ncbi:unnamed protein product [Pseudo-nitzschia multistriata]|uniref:Uncharacterized protein n=1 Tax=Pseudo-nitzschia multistriata TaxID=183589 RepID=A0A448YYL4_9STRA|nr:unnamed protein product [Pseudo-nitzschia multistriata]